MDANFGLVRKMNSGTSALDPKHNGKVFVKEEVNRHLASKPDKAVEKNHVSMLHGCKYS